jgi:hypothetical protein
MSRSFPVNSVRKTPAGLWFAASLAEGRLPELSMFNSSRSPRSLRGNNGIQHLLVLLTELSELDRVGLLVQILREVLCSVELRADPIMFHQVFGC